MGFSMLKRYWITALIFMIIAPLFLWISSTMTRQQALEDLAEHVHDNLMLYVRNLEARLAGYEHLVLTLSSSMQVVNLLRDPSNPNAVQQANHYLTRLNDEVQSNTIYLMDPQGLTLAASNWQAEKTFFGKNYGFRAYFQQAMRGEMGRDVALGSTSDVLGYYVAYPVEDEGRIIGVAVVKVDMDGLRLFFTDLDLHFFLADSDGVIFISSDDSWRFNTVRPLSAARKEAILEMRRYPEEKLSPWVVKQSQQWDGVSRLLTLPDDREYFSQTALLLSRGWEVHALGPTDPVGRQVQHALVVGVLACAFSLLLVLFLQQRRDYLQDLRAAAIHDSLTGLYTRRYMQDAARAYISRVDRGSTVSLAAAMIDIDHFKRVNDEYGHRAGDQVLRLVGQAIAAEIRRGDIPVRYGGEEFTVIFGMSTDCAASSCVRRILARIKTLHFNGPIRGLQITASAGIAHYQEGEILEDLLGRADELLYQAKRDGRDRFYDDGCSAPAPEAGEQR